GKRRLRFPLRSGDPPARQGPRRSGACERLADLVLVPSEPTAPPGLALGDGVGGGGGIDHARRPSAPDRGYAQPPSRSPRAAPRAAGGPRAGGGAGIRNALGEGAGLGGPAGRG